MLIFQNQWNGPCKKNIVKLREYTKSKAFEVSFTCNFRQFAKKGAMAKYDPKSRAHANQWSQQFKFLFKNCNDLTLLELYASCIELKMKGELLHQKLEEKGLEAICNGKDPAAAQVAVGRFSSAQSSTQIYIWVDVFLLYDFFCRR